jgi:hypothetical protein
MNAGSIKNWLLELEHKDGVLMSSVYNSDVRDRTKWYTIPSEFKMQCIAPTMQSDALIVPPIAPTMQSYIGTDINTDINTDKKQIGGFENFQQEEIQPPMPKTILSELFNYWLQVNPEYKKIATPKVDNPAIRQIAEIITKNKMFHTDPEKTMKMWRAFCQVILNNDFYKNKPLKTICNNIQTFLSDVQAAANGQYVPPKNKNGSAAVQLVPQKINLDQKPQILLNGGAPIRL